MFKPIPGFSNYEVDEYGNIQKSSGLTLRAWPNSAGYLQTKLQNDDGKRKTVMVHRAVYLAHIGLIPNGMWINHKDGVKDNNHIDNLECGTPSYNHIHARDVLKRKYASGPNCATSKFEEVHVEAMVTLRDNGWSQHKIAKLFGCSQSAVSQIFGKDVPKNNQY